MRNSILLGFIFFISFSALGNDLFTVEVGKTAGIENIGNRVFYLMDEQGQLNYEQASTHSGYQEVKSDIPNFGITEAAVWLKLNLRNVGEEEEYLFQITQPGLDELTVYFKEPSGKVWSREAGEHLSFGQRTFHDPNYIFKLRIPQGEIIEVFLRVKARDNVQVPMQVGTYEAVFETNKTRDLWVGIYVGLMLVMLVYNLFIYFTVRDKAYLYYIIYIGAVILTQVSILGYTFPYLWPDSPKMAYFSSFIFPPLVGVTSAIFMRAFLHTAELLPRMDKFWLLFAGGYVVSVILALSGFFPASFQLIEVCAMGLSLFMMAEAIVLYRRGSRPAGFFLVAWSIFLIGVSVYVMKDLGVLPYNNFTLYTMPIGSALEVVLLSFALADRINILQQENEQVQAEKIAAMRENERLVSEQNVILERKVHERTLQLEETNTELSTTLNHLKETQAQLVDAEKMASLGQLTAGIAHEINNPINFVSANVNPLRRDFQDILEVLGKYEHLDPDHDIRKQLKEIEKFKEQIDMKFIPEEIMSLLQGIEHGASRTAEIVKGLKNFSRLDESDIKDADVNEGIESTLTLLKHTFPPNLKLETYFAPLGMIECYPGKLNQVFMNVLNNGIQAMAKMEREEHVLSIQTLEENQQVVIKIKDTGIGMTPEVKAKVFEPFFTTKDVGEGTGLGMSIVFKIIESHHGKIELESKPGQGTLVTIRLNRRISIKA